MALTVATIFDIVGQTQTITFNNPSAIDTITYSSGQVTFGTQSGYTLAKSDLLLYCQYMQAFFNLLNVNFSLSYLNDWPLCNFQISDTFAGVNHLTYTQTSTGNNVLTVNYVPQAVAASVAARSSISISLGEFYMFILMLQQYKQQINFN